jgi:hypothetical protein
VKLLGSEASKASLGACVVLEVCVATGGLEDVVGVNVGFADVAILGKCCVDVGFDRGWGQGEAAEWIA